MSQESNKPYLPLDLVTESANPLALEFWCPGPSGGLRIQRCTSCGDFRHPPLLGCPNCGSPRSTWDEVSGRGTIFSYTIATHPVSPQLADYSPYNIVLVELDDAQGIRIISNLVDTQPNEITIGIPVTLEWHHVSETISLPRFRRT